MGRRRAAIDVVVVDKDVLKRRMEAARILRGMTQVQLGALFEEDGLGKHDVGRLERGEADLRRIHLDALVRHLRLPDWWFIAPEIEFPDTMPGFDDAVRQIVEASIKPIIQELMRPPPGLMPPQEDDPSNAEDPGEPENPPPDPEPR